jgi:hypothetical protein
MIVGNDLEDDQPVRERRLGSQVGLPRSAPAELHQEPERAKVLADLGEHCDPGERPKHAVASQENLQLILPPGKSAHDLGRVDILA